MRRELDALLERIRGGERPRGLDVAVARSGLALATLLTLLANPGDALFKPVSGAFHAPPFPSPVLPGGGLFHLLGIQAGYWVAVAVLLLVCSGWRPRISGVLHFFVAASLTGNASVVDGGDFVCTSLSFLLLPWCLTDDRTWHWNAASPSAGFALRAIERSSIAIVAAQVALIYAEAAIAKTPVEQWSNGTALFYWFKNPTVGAPTEWYGLIDWVFSNGTVLALITYGVLVLELALAVSPLMRSQVLRVWLWGLAIALHGGIILVHGLGSFGITMICAATLLLRPSSVLDRLAVRDRSSPTPPTKRFIRWALPAALVLLPACTPQGPATAAPAERTPAPEPPRTLPAGTEEVRFPSGDLELEGTLHLPARASDEKLPAIVLIHGSGPISRRGEGPPMPLVNVGFNVALLEQLAEGLAKHGYIVLTYDKRSCFSGNGCDNDYPEPQTQGMTIGTFQDDASAALDFLKARPDVDPDALILGGHSQGAAIAPELAVARGDVAALLLYAAAWRPIDELLAFQAEDRHMRLEAQGVGEATRRNALKPLDQALGDLASLRAGNFEGDVIMGGPTEFWTSWFELDANRPSTVAKAPPTLVVLGEYDWQVPSTEAPFWEKALENQPKSFVSELPCVTHMMVCVTQGNWQEITPQDVEEEVYELVFEDTLDFLQDVLGRESGR